MADIALGFGVCMDVVIEKNRRRSRAALRILRLNSIQRCKIGHVNFLQALKYTQGGRYQEPPMPRGWGGTGDDVPF